MRGIGILVCILACAPSFVFAALPPDTADEPVFRFRGEDRDRYAVQGVGSFLHDAGGRPAFAWKKGTGEIRLWYASRWGVKPFPGPRELRLSTSGACSGTAVVKLRPLGGRKELSFEAPWRETTVFRTDLPSRESHEFVDIVFRPDPACDGKAVVTGLSVRLAQSDAEALRLDVDTGTAYHALVGGRRPVFLLSNPSARTVAWKGKIALRDFFGRGFDVPVDVTARAGETVRLAPERDLRWKGYWSAVAEIRGGDGSAASAKTTFALIDEHPVTPVLGFGEFRIGTVCHIEGYTPYDREICYDALVAMGAKMVRCNLCMMGLMQPNGPDEFRTDLQDEVLAKFAEHGLAVDTLLTWAPRWSFSDAHGKICDAGAGIGPITPEPGPFAAFCEKLARRYGTKIAYYEPSNEVDLRKPECGTTEELIASQKAACEAIKRACPEAKVLTPGFGPFSSDGTQVRVKCQEELCVRAKDFYDAHAVHAHGGFLWFADSLKNVFMKWRRERGVADKPWFPNETALATNRGQESDAAEAVWKKILLCRAYGAIDYCWYNLRAKGWDDDDGETSYGMLTADYHPRMTYPAFSALAATMGGFLETHRFDSVNDRFVFRLRPQAGVDTLVVVGWDENALEKPWPLSVRTDARRAFLVDMMGNAEETAVRDGRVALPLSRRPCAVRLEGATFAAADETALKAPPQAAKPTARIPREDIAKRPDRPDLVLAQHRQVKELYEANPVYRHRTWQGEKDLSVRAWFGIGREQTSGFAQPDSLRLVLEVSDDVERLADDAGDGTGDSVEPEFRFPSQNGGWKFAVARRTDGAPSVRVLAAPPGFAARAAADRVRVAAVRSDGLTRYDICLPFSGFGISPESDVVSGFRFNVRAYDDDGEGSDGWIELKEVNVKAGEYDRYPLIVFDGKWKVK